MAYISYIKLWENEFDSIVSKRDKLQDLNTNQLKLEVYETYEKDEKITTKIEATDTSDVINKGYLDEKLLKINGHISYIERDYNDFKLQYNKHSVEEVLIQRAVKTTIQILFDNGLFDNYANVDKILEDFLFTTRRGVNLEEVNDDVRCFFLKNMVWKINQQPIKKNSTSPFIFVCEWCKNLIRRRTIFKWYRNCEFTSFKGTHWDCYIHEKYFDSYGTVCPKNLSKFIIKQNGHCWYSE